MSGSSADPYDEAGLTYNVDPNLLRAVVGVEDPSGDPAARSRAGAVGLGQLMPATARNVGVTDRTAPKQSIFGAAAVLRENLDRYGNVPDALRAYNGGTDPSKWGNSETAAYVPKVAAAYARIAQAGAPAAPAADPLAAHVASMDAQWGVSGDAPAPAAPAASAAPAADDAAARVAAQDKLWGVDKPAAAPAAQGQTGQTAPADPADLPPQPGQAATVRPPAGTLPNLAAGLEHGAYTAPQSLWAKAQQAGDAAVPALGWIDAHLYGQSPEMQAAQRNALATAGAQYDAGAGQTIAGQAGNLLGNAAVTAPLFAIGGAGLGLVGDAAASTVRAVPYLGRAAQAGADLLAGRGGATLAGKMAAGSVSGSAQGAGAAELTGGDPTQGALTGALGGGVGGAIGYAGGKLYNGVAAAANELGLPGALQGPARRLGLTHDPAPPGAAPAPDPAAPGGLPAPPNQLRLTHDPAPPPPPQPPGATPAEIPEGLGPQQTGTPGTDAPPPDLSPESVAARAATLPQPGFGILDNPGAQRSRADDVIAHFAGGADPVPVPNPANSIPGVNLTAGPLTGNAGVASLEQWARLNPLYKQSFLESDQANNAARLGYLRNITGTPETIAALTHARQQAVGQLSAQVFDPDNMQQVNAQPVVDALQRVLNGPGGQRNQVRRGMQDILDKVQGTQRDVDGSPIVDAEGNPVQGPQTNPEYLYRDVRGGLDDLLSQMSMGTESTPLARREVMGIYDTLDPIIESGAPGFGSLMATHEAMSRPIDSATYLQKIFNGRLTAGTTTQMSMPELNVALSRIAAGQAGDPIHPANSITPDQLAALTRLRNNLATVYTMGKAANGPGSATMGNFATNAIISSVGGSGKGTGGIPAIMGGIGLGTDIMAQGMTTAGMPAAAAGYVAGQGVAAFRRGLAAKQDAANAGVNEALVSKLLRPQTMRGARAPNNVLSGSAAPGAAAPGVPPTVPPPGAAP